MPAQLNGIMAHTDNLHILIAGAGSTGLLLAQGLKQNGIKATVFERESSTSYQSRPREWGMTLHWGSSFISKCIPPAMHERLNNICCDPFYGDNDLTLPHYNGQTGEKLFDMPGEQPRRISRRKLRNFLSEGIDVQYGKQVVTVSSNRHTGTTTALFTDGTSASGSLLVGCDGAKSAVREALLGKDAAQLKDLDINMINISCAYSADTAKLLRGKHPCFKNSYHPTQGTMFWQSIQDVEDPDRPETWLYQNILSWVGAPRPEDLPDQAARTAFFKSKAEEYAEPWRSGALEIPDDLSFGIDRTTIFTPPLSWSDNFGESVTLAGDAAHAMPPHRGQGLNNALEDAARLVEELTAARGGNKTLGDAVRAYEEDMRARTLKEIPISVMQARMVHSWEDLMNAPMIRMGMNKLREENQQRVVASVGV